MRQGRVKQPERLSHPNLLSYLDLSKINFQTRLNLPEWINFSFPAPVTQQGGGTVNKIKSVLGKRED